MSATEIVATDLEAPPGSAPAAVGWLSPRAALMCVAAAGLIGSAAALSILAGFGADPMTGFLWASSQHLGWSVAATSMTFNGLLLVLCVALRLRVSPAAVVLTLGVGPSYEAVAALLAEPAQLWLRVAFLASAVVIFALGVALLLASGWGGGGFEVLMVAAARTLRRQVWETRLLLDVVVASAAVALGAPLGVGIAVCTSAVAPALRVWQRHPRLSAPL